MKPQPTPGQTIEPYADRYIDGSYLIDNPDWHEGEALTKAGWVASMLRDNGITEFKSLVDVGCGAGHVLAAVRDLFPKAMLHGFDISPVAIQLAKDRYSKVAAFDCRELSIDSPSNHDVALFLDVFEHVPDYLGFISATKGIAVWKVYHIPLDISVQSVLRGTVSSARDICGHLHYFTAESALRTLRDCGLEVVSCRFTAGALEVEQGFKTQIANIPRRLVQVVSRGIAARLFGGYSLLVLAR